MLPLWQEGPSRGQLLEKAVQISGQGDAIHGEMEGQGLGSRGATAPPELAASTLTARTAEKEAACRCVGKKYGSTTVTSDFRGLDSVTVGDSYLLEDLRSTLDWMGSKNNFSTFDLKDGFFK